MWRTLSLGFDAHSLVGVSRHFRGTCCLCVCPRILCCCYGSWNVARKFIPRERIPQSSVFERLIVIQLVKKSAAFLGGQSTSARHYSPSRVSSNQSTLSHRVYFWSTWILSCHLRLGLPCGLFPSGFRDRTLVYVFTLRARCNLLSDSQLVKRNVASYSQF
jgi:hypothetical protein